MTTTKASRAAFGPVQLAEHLGLTLWQRDRAIASGDIPAPDRAGGKWSHELVGTLDADTIRRNAGNVPDVGAERAAEVLADRLGCEVTADGVRELARAGKLTAVGRYKGWRLFDGRAIEAWTDVDALAVAERDGQMVRSGWAVARLNIREVDLQHLVRAGLLRARRHVTGQWGSRVPLYRAGDVEELAGREDIDWAAGRGGDEGQAVATGEAAGRGEGSDDVTCPTCGQPVVSAERRLRDDIRETIYASGVTQRDLAVRLGLSEKHLSQVLTGHAGLRLDLAERILAALGRRVVVGTEPAPREESRA